MAHLLIASGPETTTILDAAVSHMDMQSFDVTHVTTMVDAAKYRLPQTEIDAVWFDPNIRTGKRSAFAQDHFLRTLAVGAEMRHAQRRNVPSNMRHIREKRRSYHDLAFSLFASGQYGAGTRPAVVEVVTSNSMEIMGIVQNNREIFQMRRVCGALNIENSDDPQLRIRQVKVALKKTMENVLLKRQKDDMESVRQTEDRSLRAGVYGAYVRELIRAQDESILAGKEFTLPVLDTENARITKQTPQADIDTAKIPHVRPFEQKPEVVALAPDPEGTAVTEIRSSPVAVH